MRARAAAGTRPRPSLASKPTCAQVTPSTSSTTPWAAACSRRLRTLARPIYLACVLRESFRGRPVPARCGRPVLRRAGTIQGTSSTNAGVRAAKRRPCICSTSPAWQAPSISRSRRVQGGYEDSRAAHALRAVLVGHAHDCVGDGSWLPSGRWASTDMWPSSQVSRCDCCRPDISSSVVQQGESDNRVSRQVMVEVQPFSACLAALVAVFSPARSISPKYKVRDGAGRRVGMLSTLWVKELPDPMPREDQAIHCGGPL